MSGSRSRRRPVGPTTIDVPQRPTPVPLVWTQRVRRESATRVRSRTVVPMYTLACVGVTSALRGQAPGQKNAPPSPATLPTVQVTVTRETNRSSLELPFGISVTRPDSSRPGQRNTNLEETLLLVPGVTVQPRTNPAQDPRLVIRGFGARSAFGVRGIRVLRDGIPLTLPDGQTPVDYLDLENVGTVEVIRGSASALYGNASGGVIDLRSRRVPSDPLAVQARAFSGSYGMRRWVGAAGGTVGPLGYDGSVSHVDADGYRQYSRQRATNSAGRATVQAAGTDFTLEGLFFNEPDAQDPGALTKAQFDANPRLADPFWIQRQVGKVAQQGQFGLVADRTIGRGEMQAMVYAGGRALSNPRPTFIVDLNRHTYGASLRGSTPFIAVGLGQRVTTGVDYQDQRDNRRNFANCIRPAGQQPPASQCPVRGSDRGVVQVDQRELVSSIGAYVRDELELGTGYRLVLGARADQVRFEVQDHRMSTGGANGSGVRTMGAVSPMVGVVARLGLLHALYANVNTAFETPTITELGNQPDGSGGLNRQLNPQRATTAEMGVKGLLLDHLSYDVALFSTGVRDELVPFDVPNVPGRTYFRNAGRTRRRGAEVGLGALVYDVELAASYSWSRFNFVDYKVTTGGVTTNFAGDRIPGIPEHQFQGSVTGHLRGSHGSLYATVEGVAVSSVFGDDTNAVRVPGYQLMHLRLGGTAVFGRPWLAPVLGIQNVFDRKYVPSVAVNATQGKYYEPGPGRTVYIGLTLAAGH